jgi:hypothetical protein
LPTVYGVSFTRMFKLRRKSERPPVEKRKPLTVAAWAKVGMRLTFRAELMPGRARSARTYEVARVLASGRVELNGLSGQHTATEFEATR